MSDIHVLFLRKITEILPCSSDLNPSQQSSSSGDLRPEMMDKETPPPAVPSCEAGDPEVSSRRVSPNADLEKGLRTSPAPSGARSKELKDLLGRASISAEHRVLMNTVIRRISSTESGLYEAARSLLIGFEVREMMYLLTEPHI